MRPVCFVSESQTLTVGVNWHCLNQQNFLISSSYSRTTLRSTPLSCEAKQTRRVWRAYGRVPSMWCRCELGPWLVLANTAARCASKRSQMVRMAEPGGKQSPSLPSSSSVSLCLPHSSSHSCRALYFVVVHIIRKWDSSSWMNLLYSQIWAERAWSKMLS